MTDERRAVSSCCHAELGTRSNWHGPGTPDAFFCRDCGRTCERILMNVTFLTEVLDWMRKENIHGGSYWLKDGHRDCRPVAVINVSAWGSNYADGDTENGFVGETTVDIKWQCEHGSMHELEVRPGDQMASLWDYMITRKWRDASRS